MPDFTRTFPRRSNSADSLALDLSVVDGGGDLLRALAVDGAAERHAGSEDLLAGALELDGHGLVGLAHGLGDSNNIIELDIAVVGHVLDLLAVSATLLERLDDQRSGGGEDLNSALSVLDHDLDLNLDSLPLGGGLLDVFSDLLGGETDGTALRGQGGGRGHLSSDDFHVHCG